MITLYFQTRICQIGLEFTHILLVILLFFFLLIQLVNSIATTYVGTHAYMAVRFSTFLPCNEDVPTVI